MQRAPLGGRRAADRRRSRAAGARMRGARRPARGRPLRRRGRRPGCRLPATSAASTTLTVGRDSAEATCAAARAAGGSSSEPVAHELLEVGRDGQLLGRVEGLAPLEQCPADLEGEEEIAARRAADALERAPRERHAEARSAAAARARRRPGRAARAARSARRGARGRARAAHPRRCPGARRRARSARPAGVAPRTRARSRTGGRATGRRRSQAASARLVASVLSTPSRPRPTARWSDCSPSGSARSSATSSARRCGAGRSAMAVSGTSASRSPSAA